MPKFEPFAKPYPDFPLTYDRHIGYFKKKILGKAHRFGPRGDGSQWQEALAVFNRDKDHLYAGQNPDDFRDDVEGYQLRDLFNDYVSYKRLLHEKGKRSKRTYDDAVDTCDWLSEHLNKLRLVSSLTTKDFDRLFEKMVKLDGSEMAPVYANNRIESIKRVFRYGYKNGNIEHPVKFGLLFQKPSAEEHREYRAEQPSKEIPKSVLKAVLRECDRPTPSMIQLRAMILFGINGGNDNAGVGTLEIPHIKNGWVKRGRHKNGYEQEFKLWPETLEALNEWLAIRKPKNEVCESLVFFTKYGLPWYRDGKDSPLSSQFGKLKSRKGFTFRNVRHSFRTKAANAGGYKDVAAIRRVMGHKVNKNDMDETYNESIDRKRLIVITDYVRAHYATALKRTKRKGSK